MSRRKVSSDFHSRSTDPYRQVIFWKKVSLSLVLFVAAVLIFETTKSPITGNVLKYGTNGSLPIGTAPSTPISTMSSSLPTIPNQGSTLWVVSPKCNCVQMFDYGSGQSASTPISVPSGPVSMIDDPTGLEQYILSENASTITIISLLDLKIIKTLNFGNSPNSMWINYSTVTLFATNSKNNTLSSLSLAGLKNGFTVYAGPNPTSVVANASGTVAYVADAGNNTVLPIDLTSKTPKLLTPIPVGKDPVSLYLDPLTNKVIYVVNHDSGTISLISLPSNQIIATVNVGGQPDAISVDPNTHIAYVAISNEGVIVPINLFNVTLENPISVGPDPTTVTAGIQGSHIFVTVGGNNTGVYIDPKNPSSSVVSHLPPGVINVSYFVPTAPE